MSSWERSSALTFAVATIASVTTAASSRLSGSTWIWTASSPAVLTIGLLAPSTPESRTACRRASASSWVAEATGTRYWVPPVNSMPRLRPL